MMAFMGHPESEVDMRMLSLSFLFSVPLLLSPICLFMTLLIPEVTGLDLVLARVGSAATHILSAWDAHLP